MTRRTIYRIALATLMLPNFTAYWWLLPRRMKRFRTERHVVEWLSWQRRMRDLFDEYSRYRELMDRMANGQVEVIGEREFRIPFRLVSNPSGENWLRDRFLAGGNE